MAVAGGHSIAGRRIIAPADGLEVIEQESMLRGIVQRRAGGQQRGAARIVEIEAERYAGGDIIARERDVICDVPHRKGAERPRELS